MKNVGNLIINSLDKQKKSKSVLILIGLSIILIVLSFLSTNWFKLQMIKNIKINGNVIISNGEIYDIVSNEVINIAVDDIDLLLVKQKLEKHPYISIAKVWINSNGILSIEIKENMPIAIVVDINNELSFIDDACNVMPYRFYSGFTNLPIVNNVFFSNNKINKSAIKGASLILTELSQNYKVLSNILSEIKYIEHYKMYELFLTDVDCPIYIGRTYNLTEKIENLYMFWKHKLLTSFDIQNLLYIDIRWKDVVVIKKKSS